MRLEDSEGATACPDDDDLATFAAGRASPALNDAIQAHLAGCGGCFAILAALARDASGTTGGAGEELDATAPGPDPTASLASGAVIDRYLLLECLGAGGMGVVYSAYDRELDRKVALKVLLAGSSAAGAPWLLREAQALAQLAHPNVVAVHDVGTVEGRVWIAMEHVAGDTLRGWSRARRRGWQDVVRVLVDVARGVAAAHDAGLVHRDLKLENVMIGDDGRVRVLDFGLAHGRSLAPLPAEAEDASAGALALRMRLTRTGAIQGTPATMAPEQWEGRDAGPAADQFAWSVMAWELLHGERPFAGDDALALARAVCAGERRPPPRDRRAPAWLRRVIERGLARDPARRWPDMRALSAAIERGQARARWRVAAIAGLGVAAIAAGIFGLREADVAARTRACEREGASIREVWGDEARARLRAAMLASGVRFAAVTFDKVTPWLDAYADAWAAARGELCVDAEVRGRVDADHDARARGCLDERRAALAALVDELTEADPLAIPRAVPAAADLEPIEPCRDAQLLERLPAPPRDRAEALAGLRADLARASTLAGAGKYDLGLEVAEAAVARADALGWPPLRAAARARLGDLLERTGRFADAEAALEEAYFEAARAGAPAVAADACVQLIYTVGTRLHREADGLRWARQAEVMIEAAGDEGGPIEARRLNHRAMIEQRRGEFAASEADLLRALSIQERALGERHPTTASTRDNLGFGYRLAGDYAAAKREHTLALAIEEEALGPAHPRVAEAMNNLALVDKEIGDYDEALRLHARALAVWEEAFGADDPGTINFLSNLSTVHRRRGAHDEALRLLQRAIDLQERVDPTSPTLAALLNNLAAVQATRGDLEAARPLFARALALKEATVGADDPSVASSLCNLAEVDAERGDLVASRSLYGRALAIYEARLGDAHPSLAYPLTGLARLDLREGRPADATARAERALALRQAAGSAPEQVAEAQFLAAEARWAARDDRPRALALARDALAGYQGAGEAAADDLAAVAAWLAERDAAATR